MPGGRRTRPRAECPQTAAAAVAPPASSFEKRGLPNGDAGGARLGSSSPSPATSLPGSTRCPSDQTLSAPRTDGCLARAARAPPPAPAPQVLEARMSTFSIFGASASSSDALPISAAAILPLRCASHPICTRYPSSPRAERGASRGYAISAAMTGRAADRSISPGETRPPPCRPLSIRSSGPPRSARTGAPSLSKNRFPRSRIGPEPGFPWIFRPEPEVILYRPHIDAAVFWQNKLSHRLPSKEPKTALNGVRRDAWYHLITASHASYVSNCIEYVARPCVAER